MSYFNIKRAFRELQDGNARYCWLDVTKPMGSHRSRVQCYRTSRTASASWFIRVLIYQICRLHRVGSLSCAAVWAPAHFRRSMLCQTLLLEQLSHLPRLPSVVIAPDRSRQIWFMRCGCCRLNLLKKPVHGDDNVAGTHGAAAQCGEIFARLPLYDPSTTEHCL